MKKLILFSMLALGSVTTQAAPHHTPVQMIEADHVKYVLEEASEIWNIPVNELTFAYNAGQLKIEETGDPYYYRVLYGGGSIIVSIEDRL